MQDLAEFAPYGVVTNSDIVLYSWLSFAAWGFDFITSVSYEFKGWTCLEYELPEDWRNDHALTKYQLILPHNKMV